MAQSRGIFLKANIVGAVCILAQSGCSYIPTLRMDYAPLGSPAPRPAPYSLAVTTLEENRPPRHYPSQLGRGFLTYVPLLPYVNIPYERLDESLDVTTQRRGGTLPPAEHFTQKIAEAIHADLRQSGLFRDVQLLRSGTPDTDYVLSGRLRSSRFDVNVTSYMLGMAGVLLWIAPIPLGSNTADVHVDLTLTDRAGHEVWQHSLKGHSRRIFTFYNSGGAPVSNRLSLEIKRYGRNDKGIDGDSLWAYHADALRSGMAEAKASLAAFLAKQPAGAPVGPAHGPD